MAAPSDNSNDPNSKDLSIHTGEGVVIDIGTGDGRFVSAAARANPRKLYIGIDANAKPLEKISMKATRKASKGGLPNALFLQAAVEDLPEELVGAADEIHIHFPWGSLLRAVATGDRDVLASLRRICAAECLVEIVIGIDEERDRGEIDRLGLPKLTTDYLEGTLGQKYSEAGFQVLDHGVLAGSEWSKLQTSWARKLQNNPHRSITFLILKAV